MRGIAYGPRGRHRPPRRVRDGCACLRLGTRGGAAPLRAQGLPEAQLCDAQGVALRERWRCRIVRTTSPCRNTRKFPCSIVQDRKSTRLNSSHANISYAVFCLKKKKILVADEGCRARTLS